MGKSLTDVTVTNASLRPDVYEEGYKSATGDRNVTKNQVKRQQKLARKQVSEQQEDECIFSYHYKNCI